MFPDPPAAPGPAPGSHMRSKQLSSPCPKQAESCARARMVSLSVYLVVAASVISVVSKLLLFSSQGNAKHTSTGVWSIYLYSQWDFVDVSLRV